VAAGEPLSFAQDDIVRSGHAIECRINAEDPAKGFLPSPGTISRLRVATGPGVRWDGGYDEGDTISQYYDNLVGKLVVWAHDRPAAIQRMLRALREMEIGGIRTTIPAHQALLSHPDFAAGEHSTKWVENDFDQSAFAAAVSVAPVGLTDASPPLVEQSVPVEVDGKRFQVTVWMPELGAAPTAASGRRRRPTPVTSAGGGAGNGTIAAPMQGTIVKVLVALGDEVSPGQAVLVLEAMKMENHINAETGGTVREVRVSAGDTVGTGDVLIVIE
jgi:acetyl-CoA/propionyl-CoA carboxylase biotin carboxyl carrier protein